ERKATTTHPATLAGAQPTTRAGATLLAVCMAIAGAAARADESPVDEARQVLGEQKFPWYDAEQDELKPVRVVQPARVNDPTPPNWRWNLGGMSLGQILVWSAIIILLIAIAAAFIWAYVNRENLSAAEETAVAPGRAAESARIDALPFSMRRDRRDLLAEAQRYYEEGNFAEAIIYLFSHQLVEMDKRQVIRLMKGKTNRQYLSDIRRQPRLQRIIGQTMVAFEDVFFGNHALHRARFESCWRALPEFNQILAERAA
ncbi:MAG TPA: DUF4129 domain-containing protein, partial [Pirellulales bacterium]|nr:DUF4129 domain-containing protein [Pirellulales bacterium]